MECWFDSFKYNLNNHSIPFHKLCAAAGYCALIFLFGNAQLGPVSLWPGRMGGSWDAWRGVWPAAHGGDPPPVLCPAGTTSGALCPVLSLGFVIVAICFYWGEKKKNKSWGGRSEKIKEKIITLPIFLKCFPFFFFFSKSCGISCVCPSSPEWFNDSVK